LNKQSTILGANSRASSGNEAADVGSIVDDEFRAEACAVIRRPATLINLNAFFSRTRSFSRRGESPVLTTTEVTLTTSKL
jgi:hypothetical protein